MAPLGYLNAAGQRAQTVLPLTWFTLAISIVVCVVIGVLLWLAVRRSPLRAEQILSVPPSHGRNGLKWIGVGVAISSVPLLATLVWTMVALAAVSGPPDKSAVTLDVTAHQWWWEVRYDADRPDQTFSTANEIHIPVGKRILVRLHGGDVIHSFWVPKLTGKTDTIPGQTNLSWIQAQHPGRYRGQCTEYCGAQHAHMAFEVVAESNADFDRWRMHQLQPASAPTTPEQMRGMSVVEYRCGLCHQVRGTTAGAVAAPDLTHVMSRRTIAAGTLPTGPGTLAEWIEAPQALKPGSLMPAQNLPPPQLADALAYLETPQ